MGCKLSVYSSIKSKLRDMDLGNDEYFYANDLLISRLSERESKLYYEELKIADALRSEKGYLNVTNEDIESAIDAAGIED